MEQSTEILEQVETKQPTDKNIVDQWYSSPAEKRETPVRKSPNDSDDREVEVN